MTSLLRVGLIGWGAIGRTVADLIKDDPVELVVVGVRDDAIERDGLPSSASVITNPDELSRFKLDVVAEAAGRESVVPWGVASVSNGVDFIVSSASAFAEPAALESLREHARTNDAQVHIQTGALGGIDALASARLMGIDEVEHRIVKPPKAWKDTPAEQLCELDALEAPATFFSGTASETASAFPKNANVAMTTALAGIGPDATVISLVADPTASTNRHEIHAHGAFGTLDVAIANNALPANPKTSAMAALSLARALQNQTTPITI